MIESAGAMGWGPDVFWSCTPSYFYHAATGWRSMEESRNKNDWQRARVVSFFSYLPHDGKTRRITDLFQLPGDEAAKPQRTQVDAETLKRFNEAADAVFAEKK